MLSYICDCWERVHDLWTGLTVIQYTMHPTAPATSYLTNSLLHMFRHQHQLSKASRTKTDLFLLHILTRTCFLHVCRKRSPITDIIDVSLCKQHLPQRRWACPWKETLLLYSWYTTAPGGWGQWQRRSGLCPRPRRTRARGRQRQRSAAGPIKHKCSPMYACIVFNDTLMWSYICRL